MTSFRGTSDGLTWWAAPLVLIALAALACALCHTIVQNAAPDAYMDEVFHIRQAQQYCAGRWHVWDSKITTLPGLYVAAAAWNASGLGCDVAALRWLNVVMHALVVSLAAYATHRTVWPSVSPWLSVATACVVTGMPVAFFSSLLFYTDSIGLAFVLLTYVACRRRATWVAAGLGSFAILCRQTNVVWVALCAATCALDMCDAWQGAARGKRGRPDTEASLLRQGLTLGRFVVKQWRLCVPVFTPLVFPLVAFVAFVAWNGSIVVGDKTAHEVHRHGVQVLYFALFCVAWMASHLRAPPARARVWLLVTAALLCPVLVWVVRETTFAHAYVLADNRHYTFYLWNRVLGAKWWYRYAAVPVYALALPFLWLHMTPGGVHGGRGVSGDAEHSMAALWRLGFWACACAALVPAGLLEFRYFIVPYTLLRLHTDVGVAGHSAWPRVPVWLRLMAELGAVALVNGLTLYAFVAMPFDRPYAAPSEQVGRFMW